MGFVLLSKRGLLFFLLPDGMDGIHKLLTERSGTPKLISFTSYRSSLGNEGIDVNFLPKVFKRPKVDQVSYLVKEIVLNQMRIPTDGAPCGPQDTLRILATWGTSVAQFDQRKVTRTVSCFITYIPLSIPDELFVLYYYSLLCYLAWSISPTRAEHPIMRFHENGTSINTEKRVNPVNTIQKEPPCSGNELVALGSKDGFGASINRSLRANVPPSSCLQWG